MSRDMRHLLDILLYDRDALGFASGMDRETFFSDRKSQYAVIRCLEIIGEAVKRVSSDFQKKNPEIPWSRIAKMRDLLIHAYGRVNMDEVWDTLENDIPGLISTIERIIPAEEK